MAVYIYQEDHAAPAIISLSQAKEHLRVDHNDEDDLIAASIDAAIGACEGYTNKNINESKFRIELESFTDFEIKISPVQSVTGITYTNEAGAEQTLTTDFYRVYPVDKYAHKVVFLEETPLPTIKDNTKIKISVTAGYADGKVPAEIKQAIYLTLTDFYENREDKVYNLPSRSEALLRSHRFYY